MRVICIHVDSTNDHGIPNLPHPALGEPVTVIDERVRCGALYYQFQEYAHYGDKDVLYNSKNYVQVSDLDETELVTEEFEEKYCVPVNSKSWRTTL
jgi:hypothetical protein